MNPPSRPLNRRQALRAGAVLALGLTGCATTGPTTTTPAGTPSSAAGSPATGSPAAGPVFSLPSAPEGTTTSTTGSRTLLAFFSRAGENYHQGGRRNLEVGNTRVLAEIIAALVDVDVYEIRAADPYPDGYDATVARNRDEQNTDARPTLAGDLPTIAGYDQVLLGSPIWNSSLPMIMTTFTEALDFTGIQVLPFVTYAVSGLGGTVADYARLCPGATVGEGLAVRGEGVLDADPDVQAWLRLHQLLR